MGSQAGSSTDAIHGRSVADRFDGVDDWLTNVHFCSKLT